MLARPDHPASVHGWLRRSPDAPATRRELLRLSAPAVLERVVIHAGFLAFARVINGLGPLAMATNQALIGLEAICFMGADGFGVADVAQRPPSADASAAVE